MSLQVATSPCWKMDVPDVISTNLFLGAWTRTPVASMLKTQLFLHETSAFPKFKTGRRQQSPYSGFSTGFITGLQSFANVQAPRFARHPDHSYPHENKRGSDGFYIRAEHESLPSRASDMLTARIGQIDGVGTCTPLNSRPCRLLPEP